jgi:hypothetical protein
LAAATTLTVLVAGVLAASGRPAVLGAIAVAGVLGLVVSTTAPRVALLGVLVVMVAYLDEAVGGGAVAAAGKGLALMLAVALVVRQFTGTERVRMPRELVWFLVFCGALVITVPGARDTSLAIGEVWNDVGFVVLAGVILLLVDTSDWLRRTMWAVVASLAVLALLAIEQQFTKSWGRTFGGLATVLADRGAMRSGGPLSANFFGEVLAAGAVLACYLALAARHRRERVIAIGAAAAMLIALLYTLSRGAVIAIAVAAVLIALLRGVPVLRVAGVAALVVVVGAVVLPASVRDRVGALTGVAAGRQAHDSSIRGRLSENLAAVDMFLDHPLVGVGPKNFEVNYPRYAERIGLDQRPEARAAHSLYLQSLAEMGIVGSVPFFLLLALALRSSWRGRCARRNIDREYALLAEGAFVALLTFLVCAVTLHLAYPRYLWIFVALAFAAGRVGMLERRT